MALLSELYLKTAKVGASDEDFRARMEVYARCLSAYPADVACETLRGWRSTFFPTWDELASAIEGDRRISERRLRLDAFERFLCGKQDEKPKGNPVDANFIDEMKKKYSQSQPEVEDDEDVIMRGNVLCRAVQISGLSMSQFRDLPRERREEFQQRAMEAYGPAAEIKARVNAKFAAREKEPQE